LWDLKEEENERKFVGIKEKKKKENGFSHQNSSNSLPAKKKVCVSKSQNYLTVCFFFFFLQTVFLFLIEFDKLLGEFPDVFSFVADAAFPKTIEEPLGLIDVLHASEFEELGLQVGHFLSFVLSFLSNRRGRGNRERRDCVFVSLSQQESSGVQEGSFGSPTTKNLVPSSI
jgi:hypothetical protein